jgi:hypothetical protein
MTTVTSLTADRMLAIEAASVVDGDVVGDNLILTKHDGSQINAGSVRGPQGAPGPMGTMLPVVTAQPILDVGAINQIRAGRQLTAADFTNMGLSAPLGLWNLSDLTDVSGNGRNLNNKGAVPFAAGINGGASTAAQFVGSTAQALYIPDTGAADSFRIRTGSYGGWVRTAKRGTYQAIISKEQYGDGARNWGLQITSSNNVAAEASATGAQANMIAVPGVSDVCDDRWHWIAATWDGAYGRIFVDGILEGSIAFGLIFSSPAPLNIGSVYADSSTAAANQHFGRIDEAFVTADVLSEEQIRNLYCAKIPHTLGAAPSRVTLNVRRRRKGATLAVADFPTQPLRLYNFSGGSLGDEGSNGVALTNNGAAVSVAGPDGSSGNAYYLNNALSQQLLSTDAGLPSGLATRSYGCWVKTTMALAFGTIMCWGVTSTGDQRFDLSNNAPATLRFISTGDVLNGPVIGDGDWHHIVGVEDNAALDGIKRKLYFDGKYFGGSTTMNPGVLGGANSFRFGANANGTGLFTGQIDAGFVCDYALTSEQISKLYTKSLMALSSSPKNSGDHVEGMNSTVLLAIFDTLEPQHTVDLMVAS